MYQLPLTLLMALIVLLPSQALASACDDLELTRAVLARAIDQREPVGAPVRQVTADDYALYAFMEVRGGAGNTLVHHWFHDNALAAEVRLQIGGDRWRTWSSKRLGFRRDGNWRVEIRHSSGCLLGTLSPGMGDAARDTVKRIEQLLAGGDITGARLALREASQQQAAPAPVINELSQRQLPLAQAQQLIEQGNLYIARARVQSLREQWPEDAEVKALDATLRQALARRASLFTRYLQVWQRLLARVPAGAGLCQQGDDGNWWYSMLSEQNSQVVERQAEAGTLRMLVLDNGSGNTGELAAPCLEPGHWLPSGNTDR